MASKVFLIFILGVLAPLAGAGTTKKFTISGGQTVELPVSDKGALPAAADGVKVEVAGPIFGPSKTSRGKAALIWAFTLSVPKDETYSSLAVEDVSSPEAQMVAFQNQPPVEAVKAPDGKEVYLLQLRGSALDISPDTTPWVYQPGPTTIVFRLTLKSTSGRMLTLHQPTMFGDEPKAQIQKMALRAAGQK